MDPADGDDSDIKVSPAQRAYLAAFDHWLKTVWARGEIGARTDGATDLRQATLAEIKFEAKPPASDPAETGDLAMAA